MEMRVHRGSQLKHHARSGAALLTAAIVAAAAGLAATETLAQQKPSKPDTSRSEVETAKISARALSGFDRTDSSRREFGKLEWLGGVVLSSSDKRFGGWSGLAIDRDGKKLVAVSDAGTWMTAELTYDGQRPTGLRGARLGPLKARDGGPLRRDRDRDAEAVALLGGNVARGQLLIAFEQNHRIGVFDIDGDGVKPPKRYVPLGSEVTRMRALKGFEAVAEVKAGKWKGALVAIAEHRLDGGGHHTGWILSRGKALRFSYTDIGGFDPTDAVGLPNGDLIVLERRFRWLEGVKMRLRRIAARDLQPNAIVKGEVLLDADMGSEIDNMEALSAHTDSSGATVLTLMSDDNFNGFLQRTLLLQFRLRDDGAARQAKR